MSKKSMGFIFIALAFFMSDVVSYFIYNKVEGTVTRMNTGKFIGGKVTRQANFNFPTVQFLKDDSVCFYDKQDILFLMPAVGDKISVLYKNNSKDAYLNLPGSFWFPLPKILLFVLSCIAWIGVANIIWLKKKGAKKKQQQ